MSSDEEKAVSSSEEVDSEEEAPKAKKATGKRGRPSKNGGEPVAKKAKAAPAAKNGAGKGRGSGFMNNCTLSADLAKFMGKSECPRQEVVKKVWATIKEKNLYDPKNKQFAFCNDELMPIIGTKRFRTFGMMKFLSPHITSQKK